MCYPKPGPRCSAHAHKKYTDAQQKVLELYHSKLTVQDKNYFDKQLNKLIKAREKAKEEYYTTPAGILELEQDVAMHPNSSWNVEKLETAKAIRKAQMDAVKRNSLKEVKHGKVKITPVSERNLRFSNFGEDLVAFNSLSREGKTCMEEGYFNSRRMTDEQIASFKWYTADGFHNINKMLSGYNDDSLEKTQIPMINKTVANMDSFYETVKPRPVPIVVYRRHLLWNNGQQETNKDAIRKHFPVGSEYESKIYMSTSLSPESLIQADNVSVVNLEILTKRGVSVSGVSSHSNTELEYLLPRDTKYKVVSNDTMVSLVREDGTRETITVIQLEEL